MAVLDFWAQINSDGSLTVPAEIAARLERTRPVRVILIAPEPDDERDWRDLIVEQFVAGYADTDTIYDELPAG